MLIILGERGETRGERKLVHHPESTELARHPESTPSARHPESTQTTKDPGKASPLVPIDPTIQLDIRYATPNNFMGEVLYSKPVCYALPEVVAMLKKADDILQEKGYRLKVYDCYRPLSVQKKMFEKFPLDGYVMDPKKGSNHNRGAAVDVGLTDDQGNELEMSSGYDEFTEKAHANYSGGTHLQTRNREILKSAMLQAGFKGIRTEWWHYDHPQAKSFPILDVSLESLT